MSFVCAELCVALGLMRVEPLKRARKRKKRHMMQEPTHPVFERIKTLVMADKALSCACVGGFCFLVGLVAGHMEERGAFALQLISLVCFALAIRFEKNANAWMFYALFLGASFILIMMDFTMSGSLTQLRSTRLFSAD